jgi:hypothetical protein
LKKLLFDDEHDSEDMGYDINLAGNEYILCDNNKKKKEKKILKNNLAYKCKSKAFPMKTLWKEE